MTAIVRCSGPPGRLLAGRAHDPLADRDDQPNLLGEVDEFKGRHGSPFRVPPPDQRLTADQSPAAQVELGLVDEFELSQGKRLAQVELKQPPRLHSNAHFWLEKPEHVASVELGAIEREIRVFQQRRGVVPIGWRHGDADAGSNIDQVAIHHVGSPHEVHQAGGEHLRVGWIGHAALQDRKFVATKTGNAVGRPDGCLQPVRDLAEKRVADRVAQRVIDVLEAVEIDRQKGEALARPA